MGRIVTISLTLIFAALFGLMVPLARMFGAFQPMTVAFSIVIAAVFVRLNRGMPSLEWKNVNVRRRQVLTQAVVSLAGEYIGIVAINAFGLGALVVLLAIGKDLTFLWPSWAQHSTSAAVGGLVTLCVTRMGYVLWRDYDIVKLQKELIDLTAEEEAVLENVTSSAKKLADMKSSGLKHFATTRPTSWDK